MQPIIDLLSTHLTASYPQSLAGDAEIEGISLVILDSDITGLARAFIASGGNLRKDQWFTLRQNLADTKTVLPALADEAWIYFARLHALAQALLRNAPPN